MRTRHTLLFLIVGIITISSCKDDDDEVQAVLDSTPFALEYYGLPTPYILEENPLTQQGVKLGRMLFYEPMLSKNGVQTCASCHNQSNAFADTARFSIGVEGLEGKRQAMALFNLAWHTTAFFWDGRAPELHDQALMPIKDPLEMNETLENVVAKLSNSSLYRDQFTRAFGTNMINPERISLALEQFMNTIVSARSKYDDYLAGTTTLTASEQRGLDIFEKSFQESTPGFPGANCGQCHTGINFENDAFMNNGLDTDENMQDFGRENTTGNPGDRGEFKVASLRNIAITPPYMHDGRFNTLEEVIDHYNEGLQESATLNPSLAARVENGLQLDDQAKTDLVNFLKTLTDNHFIQEEAYSNPF